MGKKNTFILAIILWSNYWFCLCDDIDDVEKIISNRDGMMTETKKSEEESSNSVMIIMLSGFRWDYPTFGEKSPFRWISDIGVRAPHLDPVFPSVTYPNCYSLVTGKYPENHGILGNQMYDLERNVFFGKLSPTFNDSIWWEGAEPLWVTATKQNKSVSMYNWPGCEVTYGDSNSVFKCIEYEGFKTGGVFINDLSNALTEIDNGVVDLAMVYLDVVEQVTQQYGTDSSEADDAKKHVEMAIFELLDKVRRMSLFDYLNVIIVSDHGMTDVSNRKVVTMQNFPDPYVNEMAYAGIFPSYKDVETTIKKEFASMHGIRVYEKDSLPSKYGIKMNKRTPPLIAIADPDYYIQVVTEDFRGINAISGYHPDDVSDMRGIFYAVGPAFKRGYVGAPLSIVDLYNAVADILGLDSLENEGSKEAVYKYLKTSYFPSGSAEVGEDKNEEETVNSSSRSFALWWLTLALTSLLVL